MKWARVKVSKLSQVQLETLQPRHAAAVGFAPYTAHGASAAMQVFVSSSTYVSHQAPTDRCVMKRSHICAAQMPVPYMQPAVDERWTQRLVLQDRQLREGTVLRGNQARTRRFTQVTAHPAVESVTSTRTYECCARCISVLVQQLRALHCGRVGSAVR